MVWLKKSNQFLVDISKQELKKLYNQEKSAKAKLRLLAALQRKNGNTLEDIASSLQKSKTTIHDWLKRLEIGGIGRLYDVKQSGKPARLTKDQEKELVQKFYGANKEKLVVIQLPAYSPKLNPIEQTWKKIKKWLAITPWGSKKEFEMKLVMALNNKDFMSKMFDYYLP